MLIKRKVRLCMGSSCFSRGNRNIVPLVQKYIRKNGLESHVEFVGEHCTEHCKDGPNLFIGHQIYQNVNEENVVGILEEGLKDLLNEKAG